MDATPRLVEIADALAAAGLEAILIGNAAAALHGAPVTTIDFDFLYRASKTNEGKIRRFAASLGAELTQPFAAVSSVYRIYRPNPELLVDLVCQIHGGSFNGFRSRSEAIEISGRRVVVASLADIIKSKKEANRPKDLAVLYVLEKTLEEHSKSEAAEVRRTTRGDAPGQ